MSGGETRNWRSRRARRSFQPSWYSSSSSCSVAGCLTPGAWRDWMASCAAGRGTPSHGVPSANWSEMGPIRPVWMLQDRVIADRIGADQDDVLEVKRLG